MVHAVEREADGLYRIGIAFSAAEVAAAFAAARHGRGDGAWLVQMELMQKGMDEALGEAGLVPLCRPEPCGSPALPCEGEGFAFESRVHVLPDIPLPADLASLAMPATGEAPSPYELQEAFWRLVRPAVRLAEVHGRTPRPGDAADVWVDALAEGLPLPELSRRRARRWLGEALPEGLWGPVEKALFGLRPGEACGIVFPCPRSHADPFLRGRTVRASVRLERVLETVPKDEDELARSLGLKDEAALRGAAAMRARGKAAARDRLKAREMLVDSLLEGLGFAVPEGLVEEFLGQEVQGTALWYANFKASPGVQARRGRALELAAAEGRPKAVQSARRHMLLLALARRLGLAVSRQEIEDGVRGELRPGEALSSAMARLEAGGALGTVKRALLAGKALEALCGMARR